jgi:4'-phosphopantetheinyl transferase
MTRATLRVAWATRDDLAAIGSEDLDSRELERASRYKSDLRRQQHIGSRTLLRALLAEHTGDPARSFDLSADARGKPVVAGGPAVSISHSRDIVACAVMDAGETGIDIEFPGRTRNVAGIAERYFSRAETAWLVTQPHDRFYQLWVLKEAWLKATGTGIAGGLDSLRCTVTPPRIELLPDSAPAAALRLYTLRDGLLGIATLGAQPGAIELHRWLPANGTFVETDEVELLASYDTDA